MPVHQKILIANIQLMVVGPAPALFEWTVDLRCFLGPGYSRLGGEYAYSGCDRSEPTDEAP